MKAFFIKLMIIVSAAAALVALTMVATTRADSVTPQAAGELELVEWDGTTLSTRMIRVSSESEKEFVEELNRQYRELASVSRLAQEGDTPENSVIETEYGIVTVQKTELDSAVSSNPKEIDVEISTVQTPYGEITIEKRSFGKPRSEPSGNVIRDNPDFEQMSLSEYTDPLYASCGSNGVEFNFGSNNTLSNYDLNWTGGSYADYVVCSASSCNFKITTSWPAYYTYGHAYTVSPGYVYGFGWDDYRCR